jgi:imidazolonepropionase-like amidohydrolase
MADEHTTFVLDGGNVWDGLSHEARPGPVVVDAGLVQEPGARGDLPVVDVAGATIIPGLIEGHGHLCFNAKPDWREVFDRDSDVGLSLRMAKHAKAAVEAGITTFRDLGAPTEVAVEVRQAIRDGLVPGPDLLVAGAPVTTTGGHCHFLGGEADGEVGVQTAVREHAKAGVDLIKVMASGGNMTPGSNFQRAQYSVAELRALVADAHRLNLSVAAHCHGVEGIEVALDARVDVLEHCSFQTPGGSVKDDAVIEAIARAGLVVSPTIAGLFASSPPARKQARTELVRQYFKAGCKVIMSTDCGIPNAPHEDLAAGMMVLQEMAGVSALETLKLATSTSAELLNLEDRGRVEPGRRADLLVVDGDPLTDLEALTNVRVVVAGGRIVYRRPGDR